MQCCGHFDSFVPSLASILTKQHSIRSGKYLLKTPGNAISDTLNIKLSLDASALKNLCLWCEFQSRLLFIINLLLENFLTALCWAAVYIYVVVLGICPGSRNFTVFLLTFPLRALASAVFAASSPFRYLRISALRFSV